jgi:hypothetical protein
LLFCLAIGLRRRAANDSFNRLAHKNADRLEVLSSCFKILSG